MKVLIKQATIYDSASPYNGKTKDILVSNGVIHSISDSISEAADKIIDVKGISVSPGWVDIFAHFCDPGYEYRETLDTGANAAAVGGYTDVLVIPNTNPVVHSKSQVEYIAQKSASLNVNIHPIGAITKNAEGKELAEMFDMKQSGALAFSDGLNSIQSPGLLLKALQYVLAFDGIVIQLPDDKTINPGGLMNEGITSTQLGLPGRPSIAEELMVARDIELVKYTNSKIHFTGVSTKKSIELIAKAKADGLQVSCSVTPYHLYFCDEDLKDYDTNLKVNPPLRTKEDMLALREAVMNGIVDCIASHHLPQNTDNKVCEFEYAKNGMISLETTFNVLASLDIPTKNIVQLLSSAPRKIFSLPELSIKEGEKACITIFNTDTSFSLDASMIVSKSANSPFIGKTLKGKVTGIINKKGLQLN